MLDEIMDAGRAELDASGAAALSLRAVARRLGMVASGIYRYFPSRDSLLTALIVDAYEDIGETARQADRAAGSAGGTPMDRWRVVASALRAWARTHPSRWALVYGSPVPGYSAPQETVASALQVIQVMADIALAAGPLPGPPGPPFPPVPGGLDQTVGPLRVLLTPAYPAHQVVAVLMAWTTVIGTVSLELFGHYEGGTTDFEAVFDYAMQVAGQVAGLTGK